MRPCWHMMSLLRVTSEREQMNMTPRERVLAALGHKEPDIVPIDIGGTDSSTLTGVAYNRLKQYLGIGGRTCIWDVVSQTALIEEEVRQMLGGDVVGVHPQPRQWRSATLSDGSPCEVPARFQPVQQPDGSDAVLTDDGEVALLRRPSMLYFEPVHAPFADAASPADLDKGSKHIESFDWPDWWDMPIQELAAHAEKSRRTTDYFIAGNVYYHILAAGQSLRGFESFMMDLVINKSLAHALMERLVDGYLKRFEDYLAVAAHCDIIVVNDDIGTQRGPQLSAELYREMVKPHHARLWGTIKQRSGKPLLLHSCGSLYQLIPDLIEIGVDALNPVQVSAADMDTARLKREFGRDITFWGGGCDTQYVLPRGTPQEVEAEVQRRVEELASGGGFVFCPVHNIQPDVPPENIVACYHAARA